MSPPSSYIVIRKPTRRLHDVLLLAIHWKSFLFTIPAALWMRMRVSGPCVIPRVHSTWVQTSDSICTWQYGFPVTGNHGRGVVQAGMNISCVGINMAWNDNISAKKIWSLLSPFSQRIWILNADDALEMTLRWRHNGGYSVSNHQPNDCLLNRLFGRRSK